MILVYKLIISSLTIIWVKMLKPFENKFTIVFQKKPRIKIQKIIEF